jgi:hypothetical protein
MSELTSMAVTPMLVSPMAGQSLSARVLRRPWFPAELWVQRVDSLVQVPAAFRKHGVYLSATDLEAT